MKTLYICGDSFCFQDPEYGPCWIDLLIDALPNIQVVNLAIAGSSNYLISLQVQQALKKQCDYLIYHATSSIRQEFSITDELVSRDNITRYWTPRDQTDKSVMCNSWISADRNSGNLFVDSNDTIKEFFLKHIDFPSLIEKNYIFIDYTLGLITKNKNLTNWCWSPGGFEHPSFVGKTNYDFSQYQTHQCKLNLWDDYDQTLTRPYYHITDIRRHQNACDHYIKMLNL